MVWTVKASRKTLKVLARMPAKVRTVFWQLKEVLKTEGPTGPHAWRNYGKLKGQTGSYHCHLTADHRWVACWRGDQEDLVIEIYYAGSHQNAPY